MATINLATGERHDPRPQDYITKIAGTRSDPNMPTPLWDAFLQRVTNGDKSLQDYLQRACGYCLTGHTHEHVLFFLYGTGANGKTVFINTISGIMGDYAVTAPLDLFVATRNEQHPTGLAHLRGARLVVATETEGDAYWSEAKIKRLTGGDKIAARFMRGDFFEFNPTFKIMIAGNHVPALRHVDEAMRRRIHLIPFTVTIPKDEQDDRLCEKLKTEWPGILAWAIAGCAMWREQGLAPPEAVTGATNSYLEAEDSLGQWLSECCDCASEWAFETTADLYASFKLWVEKAGEQAPSMKRFVMAMSERGHEQGRDSKTRKKGFKGVRIIRPDYSEDLRYGA
jgi:putative DNA primase/helicase